MSVKKRSAALNRCSNVTVSGFNSVLLMFQSSDPDAKHRDLTSVDDHKLSLNGQIAALGDQLLHY